MGLFIFYTFYILYSEKFNKHYTGYTSDLEQRLRSHNELGNRVDGTLSTLDVDLFKWI